MVYENILLSHSIQQKEKMNKRVEGYGGGGGG
jgi:hypothetical protein